ncbi:MAG: hypothetical protein ACRDJV_09105 [Actinomycetota bacterium]
MKGTVVLERGLAKSSIVWVAALVASMLSLSTSASANHVDSVEILPPVGINDLDTCSPFLLTTRGAEAVGAVVDVEVRGDAPIRFCLPEVGLNPVQIDPATGDLGLGPLEMDGTIGGEATTAAGSVVGEGQFTFGINSPSAGSFDIVVFVEEPGADNDDPDGNEPSDTASTFFIFGGGDGDGTEVPGATELVTALDCVPEDDVNASGARHDFLCRTTGAGEVAIVGAEVRFDVINGPNQEEIGNSPCGYSDLNGVVTCGYVDAEGADSPAGTDTIVGFTGPTLQGSANQDMIQSTFAGSDSGGATKVASKVNIKGRFKGKVRSAVKKCRTGRKVVVKKIRRGPDRVKAKDRTNKRGLYKARNRKAKGRFYAVAKRKKFTSGGSTIICKKAKSRKLRRR